MAEDRGGVHGGLVLVRGGWGFGFVGERLYVRETGEEKMEGKGSSVRAEFKGPVEKGRGRGGGGRERRGKLSKEVM